MQVEGIEKVDLDLVFEPPWDKSYDVRGCKIGVKYIMSQIIKLSDNAANRIKQIMSSLGDQTAIGVRVAVKSGGCAGMSYVMEYAKKINTK